MLKWIDVSEVRTACIIALMMEAVRTYETLVNFYQIIRRNIPEASLLHTNTLFVGFLNHLGTLYHSVVKQTRTASFRIATHSFLKTIISISLGTTIGSLQLKQCL